MPSLFVSQIQKEGFFVSGRVQKIFGVLGADGSVASHSFGLKPKNKALSGVFYRLGNDAGIVGAAFLGI